MVQTTKISVANIVANAAMMMRVKLDKPTVTKYAKAMEDGAQFPPMLVFEIDEQLILADGFHRYSAYQKLGTTEIQAEVRFGTWDDALLAAAKADAHEKDWHAALPTKKRQSRRCWRANAGARCPTARSHARRGWVTR